MENVIKMDMKINKTEDLKNPKKMELLNCIGNMCQFITWMDEYLSNYTENESGILSWITQADEEIEFFYESQEKYFILLDKLLSKKRKELTIPNILSRLKKDIKEYCGTDKTNYFSKLDDLLTELYYYIEEESEIIIKYNGLFKFTRIKHFKEWKIKYKLKRGYFNKW